MLSRLVLHPLLDNVVIRRVAGGVPVLESGVEQRRAFPPLLWERARDGARLVAAVPAHRGPFCLASGVFEGAC
jgi:hypothetical protein